MQTELIQYLRDDDHPQGKPYGCMVALINDNMITFGVSLCHKLDKWDRKTARFRARNRAVQALDPCFSYKLADWRQDMGSRVSYQLEEFIQRASSYFQDKHIIYPRIKWMNMR